MKQVVILFAFATLLYVSFAQDLPLIANIFGDHMVLQRAPERAVLWGWTRASQESVTVSLDNSVTVSTQSNNRYWKAVLPATQAGGSHTITIASQTTKVALFDVYFGDVYICSGQSNMQFTVYQGFNASAEIAASSKYDQIRVFTVGQGTVSDTPLLQLATIEQPWEVSSPQSIGPGAWSEFSAVCWFAGRDLYNKLQVPIGLISSNWGGTIIQAWSPPDALKKCNATKFDVSSQSSVLTPLSVNDEEIEVFNLKADPNRDSVLFNAMISPLINLRLRGILWYQGENNVGQAGYYTCAFPAMIESWKALFNLQEIPFTFFFVQLAAYTQGGPYGEALAALRQAQLSALTLPYVGFATAVDLGDLASPYGNIHPRDKQTVGSRLANAIAAVSYGQSGIQWRGPQALSFTVTAQPPNPRVLVKFVSGTVGSGLIAAGVTCPAQLVNTQECGWVSLQSSDGVWHNGTIVAFGQDLTLGAPSGVIKAGLTITGVRYGYADWPVCTVYNTAGLPAIPFYLKRHSKY